MNWTSVPLIRRLSKWLRGWRGLPLRTKLTAASAAAAMGAIVGVTAVAYLAVRHEILRQVDSNLRQQAQDVHLVVLPLRDGRYSVSAPRQPGEISGYVQVISTQGQAAGADGAQPALPVMPRDLSVAAQGGSWMRTISLDHADYRTLTVATRFPGVAVEISLPLSAAESQLRTLAWLFGGLAVGGLVLATGGAWLVVRRTMRPVVILSDAAEQVAITHDLSVRMSAEGGDEIARLAASFNTMLDALQTSLTAQRQLVLDASHELRTPLASLRTNVEVLHQLERLSPTQRGALLKDVVTQLEELTGLVADVVELARGEAPDAVTEVLQLDELVAAAVERARRHWPVVSFNLTTQTVKVRGVASRIDRAVTNLLDNAAKFSPPGGDVTVNLRSDGTLAVADRGPGVPHEALPHVFQRFYRADEARALPGSGLGLAIVQQVADGHSGRVALTNRNDGGAIAEFWLPPIIAEAEQDHPAQGNAGAELGPRTNRALADDAG